jgi:hypothetical protein
MQDFKAIILSPAAECASSKDCYLFKISAASCLVHIDTINHEAKSSDGEAVHKGEIVGDG